MKLPWAIALRRVRPQPAIGRPNSRAARASGRSSYRLLYQLGLRTGPAHPHFDQVTGDERRRELALGAAIGGEPGEEIGQVPDPAAVREVDAGAVEQTPRRRDDRRRVGRLGQCAGDHRHRQRSGGFVNDPPQHRGAKNKNRREAIARWQDDGLELPLDRLIRRMMGQRMRSAPDWVEPSETDRKENLARIREWFSREAISSCF